MRWNQVVDKSNYLALPEDDSMLMRGSQKSVNSSCCHQGSNMDR
eukprot:CAMPEP_0185612364 /NCGR_PEP_ID=MMETSP0436-20130131/21296_1 /TAXON_ID=626734 ORGANISM="Favella taraikaensis, Strain Fe Narragansett Bay" /NCGR_SAMPLE_ID=MMETSP0436 /ASSEMBLY_ACC=CAM_ASM_000390 /LENGTH=43 /DNA_ID= /DNA_START= /DNA_END= /DNA_ORIENTATION=